MKLFKLRKLNSLGAAHIIVPVIAVLVIGGIGSVLLGIDHADSLPGAQIYAGYVSFGGSTHSTTNYAPGKFTLSLYQGSCLKFQSDGNLVAYKVSSSCSSQSGNVTFASNTAGRLKSGGHLSLQQDGNVVIYQTSSSTSGALWASGTNFGAKYHHYELSSCSSPIGSFYVASYDSSYSPVKGKNFGGSVCA